MRHVPPEGWEPGGLAEQAPIAHAGFVAQVLEEQSEDESTTTSGVSEVRDLEDLDTEVSVGDVMPGEASIVGPPFSPVAYRAVDGGLVVVCDGRELFVPLPGWTLEQVGSIVESIRQGDWRVFHEVLYVVPPPADYRYGPVSAENFGLGRGAMAYGSDSVPETHAMVDFVAEDPVSSPGGGGSQVSELSEEPPPLEWLGEGAESPGSTGWGAAIWGLMIWVLSLGSAASVEWFAHGPPGFLVNGFQGSSQSCFTVDRSGIGQPEEGTIAGWLTSMVVLVGFASFWHRFGVLWGGVSCNHAEVSLWLPGVHVPAVVPLGDSRWVFWLWCVLVFGLCGFGEGNLEARSEEVDLREDVPVVPASVVTVGARDICWSHEGPGDDMSWIVWIVMCVVVVTVWETLKRVVCQRHRTCETVGSQTSTEIVPLPLDPGVPNRSQILYCLWRSGYQVDVEVYPRDIQEDFHRYVGSYLRRQAVDEDESD